MEIEVSGSTSEARRYTHVECYVLNYVFFVFVQSIEKNTEENALLVLVDISSHKRDHKL